MTSRRQAKLASAMREVLSTHILFHLKDPRIQNVTVLDVEVAADVRSAKVYISVLGTAAEQKLTLKGLHSARGYLQKKVADRLQTRNTPILTFKLDDRVKKSIATARMLSELVPSDTSPSATSPSDSDPPDGEQPAEPYGLSDQVVVGATSPGEDTGEPSESSDSPADIESDRPESDSTDSPPL